MLENPKGFLLSVFFGIVRSFPENKKKIFFNFFMFCDRMDVEKPQRVPLSVFRHCETLARPGAPLGPFLVCNFFKKNFSKNFRFSTFVKEYLTLGSLFAIFEPWIWRRLGPVPACLLSQGNLQNRTCLNGPSSGFFSALCDFFSKIFSMSPSIFFKFCKFSTKASSPAKGPRQT